MVDKAILFYRSKANSKSIGDNMMKYLDEDNISEVIKLLENSKSFESTICLYAIKTMEKGIGFTEEIIVSKTNIIKLQMEKNLAFLGTVGSNAPFIGLFGTVLGIIKAFHDLSIGTKEGAAAVMAGISEALVATAVGLMVAIPAVIAFNYFQRKIKSILINADSLNRILLAYMKRVSIK
jgi:biopolymer transport protein ExbB